MTIFRFDRSIELDGAIVMKIISIACVAAAVLGATATPGSADPAGGRGHRAWATYGADHAGWGLGGVAAGALVGGSIIAVTPYGPYPYGPYPHGMYPYPYSSYRYW